jgi:AsmA-like C-terminal region
LDSRGRPKRSGPRVDGVAFKRLTLPFTTDEKFVRLCGVELRGNDLGGVAKGIIRKSDGAMDIQGTMIPVQGINNVFKDIPLFGQILGGREGIFGVTFAMGGTIKSPKTQVNPLSALAPGFLRKVFEFQGDSCGRRATAQQR